MASQRPPWPAPAARRRPGRAHSHHRHAYSSVRSHAAAGRAVQRPARRGRGAHSRVSRSLSQTGGAAGLGRGRSRWKPARGSKTTSGCSKFRSAIRSSSASSAISSPTSPSSRSTSIATGSIPLFRGIRYGNLWGRDLAKQAANPAFIDGLKLLADADLVLDTANPRMALLESMLKISDKVPNAAHRPRPSAELRADTRRAAGLRRARSRNSPSARRST